MSHEKLMWAFEKRWDFLSARSMLKNALKDSGLSEKKEYTEGDIGQLIATLTKMGERQVDVISKALFPGEAPPAAPPEAPQAPAPPEPPKAEEPVEVAEAVEEKADEAKDEDEGKEEKEEKKKSKKSKD